MNEELVESLLDGIPPQDPDFWERVDQKLARVERRRSANDNEERETRQLSGRPTDLGFAWETQETNRRRQGLLAASAACLLALGIWAFIPDRSDSEVVSSKPPAATGLEILRDAESRDRLPLDEQFELSNTNQTRSGSLEVNIVRNDPELVRLEATAGEKMEVTLSSVQEAMTLKIVDPFGRLVFNGDAPTSETLRLDSSGSYTIVLESIELSDRFNLSITILP